MNTRSVLPIAAALLAATVSVGATVPAASAAGQGRAHATAKGSAGKLTLELRKVQSLATAKDRGLSRAARTVVRAQLPVGEPEVLANIAADRTAVAQLSAAATTGSTLEELRGVSTQLRAVRPETYSLVVNGLRQAALFQEVAAGNTTAIAELTGQVDAKELEGYDVTATRTLLAEAESANDTAVPLAGQVIDQGLLLTAFSAESDREAFSTTLAQAGAQLDTVESDLQLVSEAIAAMVPVVDTTAAEPTV